MKSINFIESIPPKTRSALHRWIIVSLVILLANCGILCILYMRTNYQYQTLWATCQKLQRTKEQMLGFLQDKRLLKEQEALLQEKVTKVTKTHQKQKLMTELVGLFAQSSTAPVTLHNLEVKKKQVHLTVQSATTDNIVAYIAQLEQNRLFKHVMLQELNTQGEQHVQAIIHATIA